MRKKKMDLVEYAKQIEEMGYRIITSIREFKNTVVFTTSINGINCAIPVDEFIIDTPRCVKNYNIIKIDDDTLELTITHHNDEFIYEKYDNYFKYSDTIKRCQYNWSESTTQNFLKNFKKPVDKNNFIVYTINIKNKTIKQKIESEEKNMEINFKKLAQEVTNGNGSKVLGTDKIKISTDEVIGRFGGTITITACDIIKTDDNVFCGVLFKEDPNAIYFGGKVLTEIVNRWLEAFDLDAEKCSATLAEIGGMPITLSKAKSKKGLTYTKVVVD